MLSKRIAALVMACGLVLAISGGAYGDPGDIGIFKNVAGDEAVPKASSVLIHDWDDPSPRIDNSAYSLDVTNSEITLSEGGHYMVMYNAMFDADSHSINSSGRMEFQSHLRLDGALDPNIGWSQGYIRSDSENFQTVNSGGGIIDVAPNQTLSLVSTRTDNGSSAAHREPEQSAIQLIKLDDEWDYLRLGKSTTQTGPTSGITTVTYNVEDELDSDSFDWTSGSGDITLKTAGHYLVIANTYTQETDNRAVFGHQLELDGTVIPESFTTVFVRGTSTLQSCQEGAASLAMIIETDSDLEVLKVQLDQYGTRSNTIQADKTGVTIVKLPDDAEYIRLGDAGGNEMSASSTTAVPFDDVGSEQEMDASFTHAGSQVGVTEEDDYLFLTAWGNADSDWAMRATPWQRWRTDGTAVLDYGASSAYHREGTDGEWAGNWSGVLVGMTDGQYVEVVSERLGATTAC